MSDKGERRMRGKIQYGFDEIKKKMMMQKGSDKKKV